MGLIKHNGNGGSGTTTVGRSAALNIVNFGEQAQRLILEAQAQATHILSQAQAQAQRLQAQAAEKGYAEGFRQGQADGQADGAEKAFEQAREGFSQQTAELQKLLRQAVLELDSAREELYLHARQEVLGLALEIAARITRRQAEGDTEVAQANLVRALDLIACGQQVQARVCPAQLDQLREYAGELLEAMGLSQTVELVADASLQPGDVVMATRQGQIDARIETQIRNVVSAMTGREEPASRVVSFPKEASA